jgi:hypothetical protein
MQRVKKIVLFTLLAFSAYAIVMSPTQAADIVGNAWSILVQGITGVGDFFNALLNKK